MLKISLQSVDGVTVFELAGRLTGRWAEELNLFWRSTAGQKPAGPVRVDLSSVTFIDEAGKELLSAMHRRGVELVASGCLNTCIVERIAQSVKEDEMKSLGGKVALVTGASNGIGRAIAERLAGEGAAVVVNYGKSADRAKQVVAAIEANGGKAVALQADMSAIADVRRLVKETVKQFGRLDILVNNAGMFISKALMETTEQEFDRIFALNAKGPYFAMQEAARAIADGGRIVNISTDGTHLGFPNATAYLGTKGALEQFTKGLAHELAPRQVTVNTVSPGFTDTEMLRVGGPQIAEYGAQLSPLKRLGSTQDIADVVAFVVSDRARWLTGQNIHAGGGVVM
ncbi:MAG TPA: glucose 1-dehydrogenase [Nitrospiria bacterium]|nr:glucose 1-dehydrogenase [Nitrospiria bacterium]